MPVKPVRSLVWRKRGPSTGRYPWLGFNGFYTSEFATWQEAMDFATYSGIWNRE